MCTRFIRVMGSSALAVILVCVMGVVPVAAAPEQPSAEPPGLWSEAMNTPKAVNSVSLYGATSGWAVGDDGYMARLSGSTWTVMPSAIISFTLNSVSVVPGSSNYEAWAVGLSSRNMAHYNGTAWEAVPVDPGPGGQLDSVFMISATNGYVVGMNSKVMRYDGTDWNPLTLPAGIPADIHFHDVDIRPGTNSGWIVGSRGSAPGSFQGYILRVEGNALTLDSTYGASADVVLYSVHSVSANSAWAVGIRRPVVGLNTGVILSGNGSAWTEVPSPANTYLWGVQWLAASADGWITGTGGNILYWNGTEWVVVQPGLTNYQLYGIAMVGQTAGYIVGGSPVDGTGIILTFTPSGPPPITQRVWLPAMMRQ